MNNPLNNPSLSAAVRAVANATDATAEEARETAELIKRDRNPDNLAAYITTCARNGDLPDWLNRVRTGDTTPTRRAGPAPSRNGQIINDAMARAIEAERAMGLRPDTSETPNPSVRGELIP